MFVPIRIIIRQYFPQLLLSTNSEEKTSYLDVDVVIKKKACFYHPFLYKKKTRKRKPWTLTFIEEAWIHRTGAIFQRFSIKRRQARSEREVRVTLKGRSEKTKQNKTKHLCPAEQAQFSAFLRQTEASRRRARRVSYARKEEYKKRKAKPAVPCTHINCLRYFFLRP